MATFTRMHASFGENMRKVKASKKSGAGTNELYVPTFRHFEEMSFLTTTNIPRKGVSSATMSSSMNESDSDQENVDFNNPTFKKRKMSGSRSANKSIPDDFLAKATATIAALEDNSKQMSDEITGLCTMIDAELRQCSPTTRKIKIRQHLAIHY